MTRTTKTVPKASPLYARIRQILESARTSAARSVNTTQVVANWLIGREIVEEEQKGKGRADYGEGLLRDLAERLRGEYGVGYGLTNLKLFRKFYLLYAELPAAAKGHALRDLSLTSQSPGGPGKGHALRDEFSEVAIIADAADRKSKTALAMEGRPIGDAVRSEFWRPGFPHSNLSWTHYRTLLRVHKPEARAFYEIEVVKNNPLGARAKSEGVSHGG